MVGEDEIEKSGVAIRVTAKPNVAECDVGRLVPVTDIV